MIPTEIRDDLMWFSFVFGVTGLMLGARFREIASIQLNTESTVVLALAAIVCFAGSRFIAQRLGSWGIVPWITLMVAGASVYFLM